MSRFPIPRPAPGYVQQAEGGIAAQRIVDLIREEAATTDEAWLRFIELAATNGWKSPGCAAFVRELAKNAARAG